MFTQGDRKNPDKYRQIFLASCAFKVFEHVIYGRIALHIFPRIDEAEGGFRWGGDALVHILFSAGHPSHFFFRPN